jgi:hypothetical protein
MPPFFLEAHTKVFSGLTRRKKGDIVKRKERMREEEKQEKEIKRRYLILNINNILLLLKVNITTLIIIRTTKMLSFVLFLFLQFHNISKIEMILQIFFCWWNIIFT